MTKKKVLVYPFSTGKFALALALILSTNKIGVGEYEITGSKYQSNDDYDIVVGVNSIDDYENNIYGEREPLTDVMDVLAITDRPLYLKAKILLDKRGDRRSIAKMSNVELDELPEIIDILLEFFNDNLHHNEVYELLISLYNSNLIKKTTEMLSILSKAKKMVIGPCDVIFSEQFVERKLIKVEKPTLFIYKQCKELRVAAYNCKIEDDEDFGFNNGYLAGIYTTGIIGININGVVNDIDLDLLHDMGWL